MNMLTVLDRVTARPGSLPKPKAQYAAALMASAGGAMAGPWRALENVTRTGKGIDADDVTWPKLFAPYFDQVWIELGRFGLFTCDVERVNDNGGWVTVIWHTKGIVALG